MTIAQPDQDRIRVAAPGRINLIGEHTDYNQGFVLPATIDRQMEFELVKNGDGSRCRITSEDLSETLVADLGRLRPAAGWENYVLGVLSELSEQGGKLKGFDASFHSTIPSGSGLSSSAALECGLAFGLNALFDLSLSPMQLIRLSQQAEHNFVGTRCGIMDQFACVAGRKGHFVLLDCRNLEHRYVRADLGAHKLLLINSGVQHALADGAYNTRREECEAGVALLRKSDSNIRSLRDTGMAQLSALRDRFPKAIFRRCRFVVQENSRVLQAVAALEQGDMGALGALLSESHRGLRDDYQVSCPEVDFLVETAESLPGVLGARIMGGGFGGCSLNLVRTDALGAVRAHLCAAYRKSFGREAEPLEVEVSDGVRLLS